MLDEKTTQHTTAPASSTTPWLYGLVAVLVIAAIGLAVWAIAERSNADELAADLTAAEEQLVALEGEVDDARTALAVADSEIATLESQLAEESAVIVVGGGPLTPRQEDMVAMVAGPWADAWRSADAAAVGAMFTEDGVMYDIDGDRVLNVSDGTIEAFARRWAGLSHLSGMLVHDDRVVVVVQLAGREVGAIIDFTETGELLVESNAMYDSELGRG